MSDLTILNERYRLEGEIQGGGMAVVYRAHDMMLERTVALKILREDFSEDPTFRERFKQEARAAANLTHPSIVTVHDFGFDAGKLFIVMEYVPGTDLKSIIKYQGHLEVDKALPLLIQACAGVGYAHRAGLVHCDIKPQNLLITPDKRTKVTDFGIARALASIHPEEKSEVVWGSPQYFSPEQAAGRAPSPASDVYSLGVVLYETLLGKPPFSGETANDLADKHRYAQPPPPRQFNQNISPTLEQVILKVLSKEPSTRYRTADQFGRVLMTFTATNQSTAIKTTTSSQQEMKQTRYVPSPQQSLGETLLPIQTIAEQEVITSENNPFDIDWMTWVVGLITLIAVGGLIPLWLWVYLTYNPPTP
jgi:serine/threonine-protein kinase